MSMLSALTSRLSQIQIIRSPFKPANTQTAESEKTALANLKEARAAFKDIDPELILDRDIDDFIIGFGDGTTELPEGVSPDQAQQMISSYREARQAYETEVDAWAQRYIKSNSVDGKELKIKDVLSTVRGMASSLNRKWGFVETAFHFIRFRCGIEGRREKYRERVQVLNRRGIGEASLGLELDLQVNIAGGGWPVRRRYEHEVTARMEALVRLDLPQASFMSLEEVADFFNGNSELASSVSLEVRKTVWEGLKEQIHLIQPSQAENLEVHEDLERNYLQVFRSVAEQHGIDVKASALGDIKDLVYSPFPPEGIELEDWKAFVGEFLSQIKDLPDYKAPVVVDIPADKEEKAVEAFQARAKRYFPTLPKNIKNVEDIRQWLNNSTAGNWEFANSKVRMASHWKRVALVQEFLGDLEKSKSETPIEAKQQDEEEGKAETRTKVGFISDHPDNAQGVIGTGHAIPKFDHDEMLARKPPGASAGTDPKPTWNPGEVDSRDPADRVVVDEKKASWQSSKLLAEFDKLTPEQQQLTIRRLDALRVVRYAGIQAQREKITSDRRIPNNSLDEVYISPIQNREDVKAFLEKVQIYSPAIGLDFLAIMPGARSEKTTEFTRKLDSLDDQQLPAAIHRLEQLRKQSAQLEFPEPIRNVEQAMAFLRQAEMIRPDLSDGFRQILEDCLRAQEEQDALLWRS